jgi:hypothetical protein
MWCDLLRNDNAQHTYFTMEKLGQVYSNMQGFPPKWIKDRWNIFGINKSAMDPIIIRKEYESHAVPITKIHDIPRIEVMNEQLILV